MNTVIGAKGENTTDVTYFDWLDPSIDLDLNDGLILYFPNLPDKRNLDFAQNTLARIPKAASTTTTISGEKALQRKEHIESLEDAVRNQQVFFDHLIKGIVRLLDSGRIVIGVGFPTHSTDKFLLDYECISRKLSKYRLMDENPKGIWRKNVGAYLERQSFESRCVENPELNTALISKLVTRLDKGVPDFTSEYVPYAITEDQRILSAGLVFSSTSPAFRSGEFVLIPALNGFTDSEMIDRVLKKFFQISLKASQPHWIIDVPTEGADELIAEKVRKEKEHKTLEGEIEALEEEINRLQKCQTLLYATGTDLVDAVIDAFDELGYTSHKLNDGEKEDLVIDFPTGKVVVEVSGTKDNIDPRSLNQCILWIMEYEVQEESGKGLLITNPWCEMPLDEREKQPSIPESTSERARKNEIAVLLTTDLFNVLMMKRRGEFDPDAFAQELFSCHGLFAQEKIEVK